ncbi:MAG: YafY family transcriptional regulator [Leptospiraceae bacterium]|nr:YafY family transcriptional regulator [Leptospiraceae bacterium]
MKADRLLQILLVLQSRQKVTTSELAEELEVSPRTIHRDMEALSMSGVPIYAERGSQGGWLLSQGYRTNLTGMKSSELRALILAYTTSALGDLGMGENFQSAFLKLLASAPPAYRQDLESLRERVYIDSTTWPQRIQETPYLPLLLKAAETNTVLEISYIRGGIIKNRKVEPLGLVARGSVWYMVARAGTDYRTFRVENLRAATLTGRKFHRPNGFELQKHWNRWWEGFRKSIPSFIVEVELKSDSLREGVGISPHRIIDRRQVGEDRERIRIELETESRAIRTLLALGAEASILSPVRLRKKVADAAKRIAAAHAN